MKIRTITTQEKYILIVTQLNTDLNKQLPEELNQKSVLQFTKQKFFAEVKASVSSLTPFTSACHNSSTSCSPLLTE